MGFCRHGAFVVTDHHRCAMADLRGLLGRRHNIVHLITHVGDGPAGTAQRPGDRGHLIGRRHHVRRIVKAGVASKPTGFACGRLPCRWRPLVLPLIASTRRECRSAHGCSPVVAREPTIISRRSARPRGITVGRRPQIERGTGRDVITGEGCHNCLPPRWNALRHLAQHSQATQHGAIVMRARIGEGQHAPVARLARVGGARRVTTPR